MAIEIEQFMCLSDNFGVLIHDRESGETALIDAPEEGPILKAIERTGWRPSTILTTHHHTDHVQANLALKEKFGLTIIGLVWFWRSQRRPRGQVRTASRDASRASAKVP